MYNSITAMGRLTKDFELKGEGDKRYGYGTIAVERKYKNKDGERITDFIPFKAFGKTAELIAKYFKKGNVILLQGTLELTKSEKYSDGKGFNPMIAMISVSEVSFTGEKKPDANTPQENPAKPTATPAAKFDASDFEEVEDDEIELPFE